MPHSRGTAARRFRFRAWFAAVFALLCCARVDALDLFLKLGSVPLPGESTDAVFNGKSGWNTASGYSWGVTAESSWTKGGGASVGKPDPGKFEIIRRIDAASPGILVAITTGQSIDNVVLVARDPAKSGTDPVIQYEFTHIFFTHVEPAAPAPDGAAQERVTFVFKTIKFSYRPLLKDGTLGKPSEILWDVPAGTVTPP